MGFGASGISCSFSVIAGAEEDASGCFSSAGASGFAEGDFFAAWLEAAGAGGAPAVA